MLLLFFLPPRPKADSFLKHSHFLVTGRELSDRMHRGRICISSTVECDRKAFKNHLSLFSVERHLRLTFEASLSLTSGGFEHPNSLCLDRS